MRQRCSPLTERAEHAVGTPSEEIANLVRDRDRDRFLADLFVPEDARPHFLALHAFNAEIVRIRDVVSDPVLGEIRQEWWREVLAGTGEGSGHPVAEAIGATIRAFGLPSASLRSLVDARTFDLYNDPMPTIADFEGYAGETSSTLFRLGTLILNGGADSASADAAGHGGVAQLLTHCLLRLPHDAHRRQMFLPRDRFGAHGVAEEEVYAGKTTPGIVATVAELASLARDHLGKAEAGVKGLPTALRGAFLPLALVDFDLRRIERNAQSPMTPLPEASQWRRQLALWRTARRWS